MMTCLAHLIKSFLCDKIYDRITFFSLTHYSLDWSILTAIKHVKLIYRLSRAECLYYGIAPLYCVLFVSHCAAPFIRNIGTAIVKLSVLLPDVV